MSIVKCLSEGCKDQFHATEPDSCSALLRESKQVPKSFFMVL